MLHNSQTIQHPLYGVDDVSNINSPGLLIFLDIVNANIDEMVRIAGGPERLCPHCKTHKTREIAKLMLDRGITHHKCATIAEAEMLASVGVEDVLIAYQMVGPNVSRLLKLIDAFPSTKFTTLVDNAFVLNQLSEEAQASNSVIGVLVDLETGMQRTGIEPSDNALELVEMSISSDRIRFAGLHWYDGHNRQPDRTERNGLVLAGWNRFEKFRDQLIMNGIQVERIVAAGTGSFPILAEAAEPKLQLSPGTTTYYDSAMEEMFPELNFKSALGVLTRVVSANKKGALTLDIGHKSCAADQPAGNRLRFPTLTDAKELMQTEEHCVIETSHSDSFKPGDPLVAIPRHACPTSAVFQQAHVVSNGKIVDTWEIAARNRKLSI